MVEFSEEQKNIAKALLENPKTLEELREQLKIDAGTLSKELGGLIKLRVVERKDEKYKLIDLVEKAVKGESSKPIEGKFQAHFMIESASQDKESLEKQVKILEGKIKKENVRVDELKVLDAIENQGVYNASIETTISTDKFSDLVDFVISYGPSAVEVFKPRSAEFKTKELQDMLQKVSSAVYYYTTLIVQLKYAQLMKRMQQKQQQEQPKQN